MHKKEGDFEVVDSGGGKEVIAFCRLRLWCWIRHNGWMGCFGRVQNREGRTKGMLLGR